MGEPHRVIATGPDEGGVRALITDAGEVVHAPDFVLAGGADSAALGQLAGARIRVEPGIGWSLTVPTNEPVAGRALMSIKDHVVVNPGPCWVRIAGGMRFGGSLGQAPPAGRIAALRDAATRILPALADLPSGQVWSGARPMTADGVPIVRRVNATTVVAAGHGTLGMTLAPATAEQVRKLLL